jgi:hypothetical protein
MGYFLVNQKGMALSQFVGNDLTRNAKQLRFRQRDWYLYGSPEEAIAHKSYIISRGSEDTKIAAEKLSVSTECLQNK